MCIAIPQIISWILIIFAQNMLYILMSRFLGGLSGGGLYIIIPLFISEISDDRFRYAACIRLNRFVITFELQSSRKVGIRFCVCEWIWNIVRLHMWHIFPLHNAAFHLHPDIAAVFNWSDVPSWISALSCRKESKWCKMETEELIMKSVILNLEGLMV